MLTLTIKKKWFDMILSGEKKEEYREIKPYYKSRFFNLFDIVDQCGEELIKLFDENPEREILFRNGYHKDSPSFIAKCTLSIGEGKTEWGASEGVDYYVLTIHKIVWKSMDNLGGSVDVVCGGMREGKR